VAEKLLNRYIACEVLPGIFDNEYLVRIPSGSAALVSRSVVKVSADPKHGGHVSGEVLGYLIAEQDQRALIELSGEAVTGGLRSWVPINALSIA